MVKISTFEDLWCGSSVDVGSGSAAVAQSWGSNPLVSTCSFASCGHFEVLNVLFGPGMVKIQLFEVLGQSLGTCVEYNARSPVSFSSFRVSTITFNLYPFDVLTMSFGSVMVKISFGGVGPIPLRVQTEAWLSSYTTYRSFVHNINNIHIAHRPQHHRVQTDLIDELNCG